MKDTFHSCVPRSPTMLKTNSAIGNVFHDSNQHCRGEGAKDWMLLSCPRHLPRIVKADTHEGFCSRVMPQGHAAGAKILRMYQPFHGYNSSSGAEFPPHKMLHDIKPVKYLGAYSLVFTDTCKMTLEHATGAKPLVCRGLNCTRLATLKPHAPIQ